MNDLIKNVGIVGYGRMGRKLSLVLSKKFSVFVYDSDINKIFDLPNDNENLTFEKDLFGLSCCDLIIECAFEDIKVKKQIFHNLEKIVKRDCIIATNTSSLSINDLSNDTKYPDKFIGMHFMNPPDKIDLVEVIRSSNTSDDTFDTVVAFIKWIDKVPVESKDVSGFILNRILVTMLNEALLTLQEGVATKEDIDLTMTLGAKHPIGPIALIDMIGLDILKSILDNFVVAFGEGYRPAKILADYINMGRIGKKVGHGFYDYVN